MDKISIERAFFRILNRYIVVPAFESGLGWLISNPITGSIMVLKTTGRKSGITRYAPVNYAQVDGDIYCYQGRRMKGKWYLNILSNPRVEVLLPDRSLIGHAEQIANDREAAYAIREILKSSGLGGFIYGFNPFAITDDELKRKTKGIPIIKIKPIKG